jgi:hypothetical protein
MQEQINFHVSKLSNIVLTKFTHWFTKGVDDIRIRPHLVTKGVDDIRIRPHSVT